jgi:hypothetical protein
MLCPKCLTERPPQDFLGKEKCYRCVYSEKICKNPPLKRSCRICEAELPKSRWIYCSLKCSVKGDALHTKNYWVRNIKIEKATWY